RDRHADAADRCQQHPGRPARAAPRRYGTAGKKLMRSGAAYREALRDGRKVWLMGGGAVDDVTTHPATRAMVEEYVAWYDRHLDPLWAETLLTPPDPNGIRLPWAFVQPRASADAVAIGRAIQTTIFLSAVNVTHTPLYGHL